MTAEALRERGNASFQAGSLYVARMTSMGSKKIAVVAAALAAMGALGCNRKADAVADATREAPSSSSKSAPSAPPTAMAICRKMESAGIVGVCEASSNASHAPFDGVAFNIPQNASAGMVVQAHDAATYGVLQQKITTGHILRFDGPRVIVQVDQETPPELRAKIKPLLDGLFAE
jgi:hypothetical protein